MPHSTRPLRETRSSTVNSTNGRARTSARPVNGTRRSRREVVEEEEEEEDQESEEEAPSRRRRGAESSNSRNQRGRDETQSTSRRRGEEVEENQDQDEEEEDEGEEIEVEGGEDDEDSDGGGNKIWGVTPMKKLAYPESVRRFVNEMSEESKSGLKRKANDLARLAISCEHKRIPLKREEITKKILGKEYSRCFPVVYNRAQKILRCVFGFEMVELRARGTDNEQILQAQQTQTQRRKEQSEDGKKPTKAKPITSKSYVIVSILPPKLLSLITQPNFILNAVPDETIPIKEGNVEGVNSVLVDYKRSNSDLGKSGLTMIILGLILVSNRVLAESQLRSFLRRMGLGGEFPADLQPLQQEVSFAAARDQERFTIDEFLTNLVKQDYLERTRSLNNSNNPISVATLDQSAGKRRTQARGNVGSNRNRNGGEFDSSEEFELRWGSRSEVEFGEKAVATFISDIFIGYEFRGHENGNEEQENGNVEEDQQRQNEARKRRRLNILQDVEKAAGMTLVE